MIGLAVMEDICLWPTSGVRRAEPLLTRFKPTNTYQGRRRTTEVMDIKIVV